MNGLNEVSNTKTQIDGRNAESRVVVYLEKLGYKILDRNYTVYHLGEIDIIARHHNCLYFVEVKARRNERDFNVHNACVTRDKLKRIQRCVDIYVQEHGCRDLFCKIIGAFVHIDAYAQLSKIRLIPLQ